MSQLFRPVWDPLVRIGEFRFGDPPEEWAQSLLDLLEKRDDEDLIYDYLLVPARGGTKAYVSDGAIDSVRADERLFLDGRDIIGMEIEEVFRTWSWSAEREAEFIDLDENSFWDYYFPLVNAHFNVRDGVVNSVMAGDLSE